MRYGVGTVIMKASAFCGVRLALYTFSSTAFLMMSDIPGSSMWIIPLFRFFIISSDMSTPTTSQWLRANNAAVGSPM